jgi:hypothetical protein
VELEMHRFLQTDARSGQSDRGDHFLHTNVFLRHARGASGEAEEHIESILTGAAVLKHRVWVCSLLFSQLAPSMFVPGRFGALDELTRYIRSLVTLVTPDPNTMLRVAWLRDVKWQPPTGMHGANEKPRMMSFSDAVQIASALWVKEAGGVADLKFLMFDDAIEINGGPRLSLLRLQDYAEDAPANSDVMAAVQLTRIPPSRQARSFPQSTPTEQGPSAISLGRR